MRSFLILIFTGFSGLIYSQERIDGSFPFQTDPDKKYSVYIPSSYDENTPSELMLALHPLNINRWDAVSWCDTLINFAEENNLLVICPDGGIDGRIDDPIDTAFTSLVLDSMEVWYNVDETRIYAMGFSWGGLTTYTYGLNHAGRFAGFMPIGAAINGFNVISNISDQADDLPFYIVHGSNDNPNVRFFPLRDGLESAGACVETNYLNGVGHTIDFPNRNQILTEGINWLRSINCGVSSANEESNLTFTIVPNQISSEDNISILGLENVPIHAVRIIDFNGKLVLESNKLISKIPALVSGMYLLQIELETGEYMSKKFIVR